MYPIEQKSPLSICNLNEFVRQDSIVRQIHTNQHALLGAHIILCRADNVLFQKRRNTGYADGTFAFPSGKIEIGESPIAAAIREAKEEIGIVISQEHLQLELILVRNPSDSKRKVDFIFSCEKWKGEICNCEIEKCENLIWSNAPASLGELSKPTQIALDTFNDVNY